MSYARRHSTNVCPGNRVRYTLGVQKGDHLAVGLSFKSLGHLEDGPDTFVDALLDALGPDGTLMMNTYTEFFYRTEVELGWVDYVFDADSSRVNTGIVPEIFRQRKESIRSRHPTNSVAASGKYADYLTEGHDEEAATYLPYAEVVGHWRQVSRHRYRRSTRGLSSSGTACGRTPPYCPLGSSRQVQERRWTDEALCTERSGWLCQETTRIGLGPTRTRVCAGRESRRSFGASGASKGISPHHDGGPDEQSGKKSLPLPVVLLVP